MGEREYLEIVTKLHEINEGLVDALHEPNVINKNAKIGMMGLKISNLERELLTKSLFERELNEIFK